MRRRLAAALLAAASTCGASELPAVLLVGDSTMAPETGYGDALCARFSTQRACLNLGRGGRSTRSYRTEGLWQRVLARLRDGTPGVSRHVLIQFGHNDQPGKPGRSTDLATEYPTNLARYIAEVRAAGGTPVLVTPLSRRSFKGGVLDDDLAAWAEAVRSVAREQAVPLLDLHARSRAEVVARGPTEADRLAMAPPGAPGFDRTHIGARGACVFASILADEIVRVLPAVGADLQPGEDCSFVPAQTATEQAMPARLNPYTFDQSGWAVGTMGGRGGRILRVTTLAADGPGSLKAALELRGPRTVVFEVGGVIDLQGADLRVRHPFLTLAGQTAPAPGITLIKGELGIATHDVIVQHLMFRPGGYGRQPRSGGDHDGLTTMGGAHHVIVDHCSFSWATDENLSASGPRFDGPDAAAWRLATSHDITYSHNLIAEGLSHSVHAKGEHSKGSLIHDNVTGALLLGNLYASNRERNALFKGGAQGAMVNNLIYNPGRRAVHYNLIAHEWAGRGHETGKLALVGNVLRHGPDTSPGTPLFSLGGVGDVELHLHDNLAVDAHGVPVPMSGRYTTGPARVLPAAVPHLPPRLRALPAAQLEQDLPPVVGARPWDRDPIDHKLLSDVAEDIGHIVDSETESSGHPQHPPTRRPFDAASWRWSDMSPIGGWASLAAPGAP